MTGPERPRRTNAGKKMQNYITELSTSNVLNSSGNDGKSDADKSNHIDLVMNSSINEENNLESEKESINNDDFNNDDNQDFVNLVEDVTSFKHFISCELAELKEQFSSFKETTYSSNNLRKQNEILQKEN